MWLLLARYVPICVQPGNFLRIFEGVLHSQLVENEGLAYR